MKNSPLISVVIPVHNVEKYVQRCLRSVMGQGYDNLEIVVVDDGSTDNSGKICDDLARNDKRMRVFHKKNGGLSDARNFGIKKAKGEIIALVDSDDYVAGDYIEEMYNMMQEHDLDIVVCGYDGQIPKKGILSGDDAVKRLLINQDNTDIVAWNKIYKKKLFDGIAYPVEKKHEDTLTTYKLLSRAEYVGYIAKSLYYYVDRKDSIMKTERNEERLEAREKAAEEAETFFKDDKDLRMAAEVSMLLAKYAYVDAAVRGEIEEKYGDEKLAWIKERRKNYRNNKYMTKKLRVYNVLVGLGLYRVFRKII